MRIAGTARPRGLLLDIDGVLFSEGAEIPGTGDALRTLVALGTRLGFITNNVTRHPAETTQRLEAVLGSREFTLVDPIDVLEREVLRTEGGKRPECFVIGSSTLRTRLIELGCSIVAPDSAEEASFVIVSSTMNLNYEMLAAACQAVSGGATLFGTGRERRFLWKRQLWPSTGSVLAAIETASHRKARILGKPSPDLFRLACIRMGIFTDVVVVGDDVDVDVCGANAAGLPSALVLSGISKLADREGWSCAPDWIAEDLASLAQLWVRE